MAPSFEPTSGCLTRSSAAFGTLVDGPLSVSAFLSQRPTKPFLARTVWVDGDGCIDFHAECGTLPRPPFFRLSPVTRAPFSFSSRLLRFAQLRRIVAGGFFAAGCAIAI